MKTTNSTELTDGTAKTTTPIRLRLTKWTAPYPVTKKLTLGDDGKIKKLSTAAQLYNGSVSVLNLTIREFKELLVVLGDNDCLTYAIPIDESINKVLSQRRFIQAGSPAGVIPRLANRMMWPKGDAVLMLDYDPSKDVTLTKEELLEALYKVCSELRDTRHVWWVSTSSCLYNKGTGQEIQGISGQRIYIVVANGADIPRAGMILFKRLWLAGYGHIKISSVGSLLIRSVIDNTVWQTNRIDYCAKPICVPPLESRKPEPEILGKNELPLNTESALPNFNNDEEARYQQLVDQAKLVSAVEASMIREAYIRDRVAKLVANGVDGPTAEKTIRASLETSTLHAEFILLTSDGASVSVADVLADPTRYHGMTFHDPLEPDYHDDNRIAKARILDVARPYLHSFAHGGKRYYLAHQIETIRSTAGNRGEYLAKTASVLDSKNILFKRGKSLIAVDHQGAIEVMQQYSLLA
jgi:hypothetical protein